jgi:GMP synthase-like glutamine amidotransferase
VGLINQTPLQLDEIHHLNLEYSQMVKLKILKNVLPIFIVFLATVLISATWIKSWALSNGLSLSNRFQESGYQILIIDCESTIYSELCDLAGNFFTQEKVSHVITKRRYDSLQDIVKSKLKDFDLLIISGSSTFFPDSPEIKDVEELLQASIEQNKHAFGICFGLQLLAYLLDSKEGKLVKTGSWDEDVLIHILKDDSIFKRVCQKGDAFITRQYHKYSVPFHNKENIGDGIVLAKSKDGIEIIRVGNVVASQFHPESRYASPEAKQIFENYLREFILKIKKL